MAWPDGLLAAGPKRILSIDGGGVRGALAIGILVELERVLRERLGRPNLVLSDYFDLIGGTSVGAILAAGLALGGDMDGTSRRFAEMGSRLFGRSHGLPRIPLIQARFDPGRMRLLLDEQFGAATLGNAAWRTGFAAVAKRVDTGSNWVLTNSPGAKYWGGPADAPTPDYTPNRDYRLSRVLQASAAAPFFFDLVDIQIAPGVEGIFFDGAMTPHGNPALQLAMTALIPAYGLGWRAGADELLIISVGAGAPRPRHPDWVRSRQLSVWKALQGLMSICYDTSELAVTTLQWLGRSPQPWHINREIGGLESGPPAGFAPMWTFLRYDAPLERTWLADNLEYPVALGDELRLQRMDDPRLIPRLQEIGALAGRRGIRAEHFPNASRSSVSG